VSATGAGRERIAPLADGLLIGRPQVAGRAVSGARSILGEGLRDGAGQPCRQIGDRLAPEAESKTSAFSCGSRCSPPGGPRAGRLYSDPSIHSRRWSWGPCSTTAV